MPIYVRDKHLGDIPDARTTDNYTVEELHGARFVTHDEITGDEFYQLKDGRLVSIQSINLDWCLNDADDKTINTKEGN